MVRDYIFLASGCVAVGLLVVFIGLAVCQRLGISVDENLWVVAIPVMLAITLNILLLELYRKYRKRK